MMQYRPLGNSGIQVSAVALGCWPIAGMTSPGVNDEDSLATIRACFDLGVNHLDAAYCYGRQGQSERLIAGALASRRGEMVLATKAGQHWDDQGQTYQRNLDLVDRLRRIAAESGRTVAELVIAWTIHQPGITSALCGAKRPEQIRQNAAAANRDFTPEQLARVDQLLAEFQPRCGNPVGQARGG